MMKDMIQEDLKSLVRNELKVVVLEELSNRLDQMGQQLAMVTDLQVQMIELESSLQFASKRINVQHKSAHPSHSPWVGVHSPGHADLGYRCPLPEVGLTLQGLMVAAKEDGVDTRTACVQLAMDTLEIENASVWDLFCSLP